MKNAEGVASEYMLITDGFQIGQGQCKLLEGKTAIVTGGGKGIGKGISIGMAAAGANVMIVGRDNMEMADNTAELINSSGGHASTIKADLALAESPEIIVRKTVELYGGTDILVNNAAYQPNIDIDEYTDSKFNNVMNINLFAYMRMTGAALPYLKKCSCGRVINISSVHGKRPGDFDIGYSTSKGGISMFTREAAVALQQFGITVNALLPGGTAIEFKSGESHQWKSKRVLRAKSYKQFYRIGMPSDSANMAVFLCSSLGDHISGDAIRVDGGAILY